MNHVASIPTRISGWDRAAIVTLGGAGCALSYDALQQMAIAIHIRGLLTYLFPFVIDGFIAYGVRALLVLRTAPLAARCYVWLLFGTATAASIWANALHAVRLNQQQPEGAGLRLGDITVGVLSTLAPLALAGAVHLYILIARRISGTAVPGHPEPDNVRAHRGTADRRDTTVGQDEHQPAPLPEPHASRLAVTVSQENQETAVPDGLTGRVGLTEPAPEHPGRRGDLGGQSDTRRAPATRRRLAPTPSEQLETPPVTDPDTWDNGAPAVNPVTDDLLPIARQAVTEAGKTTRQVVANAIRGQNLPLANDRLTGLMRQLRAEAGKASVTKVG
ncbi:DUF2637 domain-containing protein [Streptomyces sp. NPDC093707]|uniref:DUF2637 domain-containing protein n=1 Tax=Streptomyces sp. NPDC093707 TaxID=3154984 RepID=UPI00344DC3BA